MKPTTEPFLMPFQVDRLSVNSFDVRDAAGHLIARVTTHDLVIEREKLLRLFAAAPELRQALEDAAAILAQFPGSIPGLRPDREAMIRERVASYSTLIDRIDRDQ